MIKNIIFDLDGTLIDTSKDIIDCLKGAYEYCNKTLNDVAIDRSNIGPPLREMIEIITPGITEVGASAIIKEFRRRYDSSQYPGTRPYEGVQGLLRGLSEAGFDMFIATNKPRVPTFNILSACNLTTSFFRDVVAPDPGLGVAFNKTEMIYYLIHKWSLQTDETVVVGDTASDIRAAHENNVVAVAVMGGFGDGESLRKSAPEHTVVSIENLYCMLMKIRGG